MRKCTYYLSGLFLLIQFTIYSQTFPNPITLSTGQGPQGTFDPVWQVSEFWYATEPSPMGLNYSPALINANCAPGSWVDATTLPPPTNNGNWITGPDADCANNTSDGYRFFRLTLDLPPDCNGFSVTTAGNYVLTFDGYVDNTISNVYINGTPQGISGGSYAAGSQLTFTLNGPWLVGTNYVDVSVWNAPAGGGSNPYGLLLVANTATPVDTDGDGVANVDDLCPCDPGNNAVGCTDPTNPNGCDINAIRTAFSNAGCIEMNGCVGNCSMYFLNPLSLSGSAAQNFAQNLGANLVSVQSQAENQCIISSLNQMGQSGVIWIGFNDEAVEGAFVWYDQSPVVYTNWAPGEPNNAGGDESCVQIYPDGMWNDLSSATANAQSVIEVNLCPVTDAGPDISICPGGTANLSIVSTLFGSPAYNYTWNNGVSGQNNPVSPPASAEFSVISTDRYQCTTSDTVMVNIYALPVVNAGPDQTICINSAVTLSGSGASTYVWNNGVNDGVAFNPVSTATYTVTGTDANGCVNTDQAIVTVNPLPIVSAGADQVICLNEAVTLSGSGASGYSWDNGVNDGVSFVPASTVTYTVTGTDANGCVNTDQVVVTVNPLPTVSAGNDQTICLNDGVTLSGSGASTYLWDNGVNDGVAFNPVSTATYTVTGTDANGCENTDQILVTVNPLPIVNAGADQVICINDAVTLSGSGASTYAWNNGVNDGVAFNPVSTATYTVTGTDANGCVNTDQVVVTVNPLPIVSAGNDQTICLNEAVTLSGSGASGYSWDNGVNNGVSFVPASTATYTVTGTDANGCVNTDQAIVTVNPLPAVNAGNDQTICLNDGVTLYGSGASTYLWDNGGIDGVAFTPNSTATYTVTGTDVNGCENTDQAIVTVNPLPIVSAGADQVICTNDAVTLSGSGASTYLWDNGGIDGVAFNPNSTATYTVTGTDANGCINTDQAIVMVNPLPNVNAGTDRAICINESVTLSGSGASTYLWDNGGIDGVAFNPASTATYTVTGTDANGCVNTDQVVVTVNPLPDPAFVTGDMSGCLPMSISFTPSQVNSSYEWSFGDGTVVTSTSAAIAHSYTSPECFTVTLVVTSPAGCIAQSTQADAICIPPNPEAAFFTNNTELTQFNTDLSLINTSLNADSYAWNFGDGSTSGDIAPSHTFPAGSAGNYTITLIAYNALGCSDTAYKEITVKEDVVYFIPNTFTPDGNEFNQYFRPVFASGVDPYNYNLKIFNRWGEVLFESNDMDVGWDGSYGNEIVQEGTYIWKIDFREKGSGDRQSIAGHVSLIK